MRAGFAQFTAFSQDAKDNKIFEQTKLPIDSRLIVQLVMNEVLVPLLGHVGTLRWFKA